MFLDYFIVFIFMVAVNAEEPCIIRNYEEVDDIVNSCTDIVIDGITVPGGEQLAIQLQEGSTLSFRGTTTFEFYEWSGPLVRISGSNILVKGEKDSVLNGQGELWWDGQGSWGNVTKPKFLRIKATNSVFDGINLKNCPMGCTGISSSENVTIKNWKIDNLDGDEGVAPENKYGHNTDGFGISSSTNILIEDSQVYNQDDCIVFNSANNVTVRNMFCHGSHGFSLSVAAATVQNVVVENSIVTMSANGIHVKTHVNSGEGLIQNIVFRNITLLDCKEYGINIQQNYRNLPAGQPQDGDPVNNVPIYNLTVEHIFGNALNGAVPVFILCAEDGCFDWQWNDITIYGNTENNCTNYIPEGYSC